VQDKTMIDQLPVSMAVTASYYELRYGPKKNVKSLCLVALAPQAWYVCNWPKANVFFVSCRMSA
jgi:hypothetical protein